ncbi:MAG: hypothetical protein FWH40_04850 [Coriobacteriia bacterium]|nr:hypothetical protein [Coriobacteriia bacterium]
MNDTDRRPWRTDYSERSATLRPVQDSHGNDLPTGYILYEPKGYMLVRLDRGCDYKAFVSRKCSIKPGIGCEATVEKGRLKRPEGCPIHDLEDADGDL